MSKARNKNQVIKTCIDWKESSSGGNITICWEAYCLDDNGKEITNKEYIIKDSWRPISRKNTEGELLNKTSVAVH